MRVLVTGAAGFIGCNLVKAICKSFDAPDVVGIDNMNDYYDVRLKEYRLSEISGLKDFTFVRGTIADKAFVEHIFDYWQLL